MSLNETPRANRLHIGIFGKRNSGKSSLINALTGQETALVSNEPGTTTDPVFKAMELHPIGPVVFIDTAGFDDQGKLGELRVQRTKEIINKTDIAIMVFTDDDFAPIHQWVEHLDQARIPIVYVVNKTDEISEPEELAKKIEQEFGTMPLLLSAAEKTGLDQVKQQLEISLPEDHKRGEILGQMAAAGDVVLLVMPQDIQAPKGRLILPQVQTIRELLDNTCTTVCTTINGLDHALSALKEPPSLIITDSQCFKEVYDKKTDCSQLTSFSVLFSAYKGDINAFAAGASAIDALTEDSKVLIAEACTHAPLQEDIGREKIPKMLKALKGEKLQVDIVSGSDFPDAVSSYDLIVHCGGCMFNRKQMLSRIEIAKAAGVPISNYGIVMAKLMGILDKITLPKRSES